MLRVTSFSLLPFGHDVTFYWMVLACDHCPRNNVWPLVYKTTSENWRELQTRLDISCDHKLQITCEWLYCSMILFCVLHSIFSISATHSLLYSSHKILSKNKWLCWRILLARLHIVFGTQIKLCKIILPYYYSGALKVPVTMTMVIMLSDYSTLILKNKKININVDKTSIAK